MGGTTLNWQWSTGSRVFPLFMMAEQSDRWSATRIGRLLIVVPFGVWWTAVFAVSILNPLFGWTLTIDDIPSRFWDIATILIPALILGDAGALAARRWAR